MSNILPSKILSKQQVTFYHENGYLVIENLFNSIELDQIITIYRDRANADFAGIMNLDREVPEVKAFVSDPRIVDILETLQDNPISLLQTMFLFKEAGSMYASQAWNPHQDNAYPQARYGAYLTGNIFFTDQDPENGGLYIYPGSHKEGLLPCRPVKSFHEKPGENPGHEVEVPPKYKKVDLRMKQGSILMLHGCVIHGSYPNLSRTRSRPMLLVPYITRGEEFIPGKVGKRTEFPLSR